MLAGSYNHAIVLSPCLYAPTLYGESQDASSTSWIHEDAARYLCTQLMSKFPGITLQSRHAIHSVPEEFWTDANRVDACFFSQASRIILFVPSDGENQIRTFTSACLSPLLTRPRKDGGRPEWHSRFLVVTVGSVKTPLQLAPGHPFIKVIRFREVGWIRDLAALIVLHREIRDFWLPPKINKPADKQSILIPVSKVGRYRDAARFRLRETVETTLMTKINTRVAGTVDPDTMDVAEAESGQSNSIQNGHHNSGGHRTPSHNRGKMRSLSRSQSRQSSSSGYQSRDPEFEAEQSDEKQVEMRLTSFMDATGLPTIWRFSKMPTSSSVPFKVPLSTANKTSTATEKQTPKGTSDKVESVDGFLDNNDSTLQREKGEKSDVSKIHENHVDKTLPAVSSDETSKRDTPVNDHSVSSHSPKSESKHVPESCLLDTTTSYYHPDDDKVDTKENDDGTQEFKEKQKHKTQRDDSFEKRPLFSHSKEVEKLSFCESPATTRFQPTSRDKLPAERPCPLASPDKPGSPRIYASVSIEQQTCFVTSVDSSYPRSAVQVIDNVTYQRSQSIVVDSLSCSLDNRCDTVCCPLVDSQCEYQSADDKDLLTAVQGDSTTSAHGIQDIPSSKEKKLTNSEPLLTRKCRDSNDLHRLTGNEERTISDSLVTTKRRIKSVVCNSENLSDSYWKVRKSTVVQVPVEVVGSTGDIPIIEPIDLNSSPQFQGSSLEKTPSMPPNLPKENENQPRENKLEEARDPIKLPEPSSIPFSPLNEDKPSSEQPDIHRSVSPTIRLVPIQIDPETTPRRDPKGVVECYSSFTTRELDPNQKSTTVKKTSMRKSVISTATEISKAKFFAPDTGSQAPKTHVHHISSAQPCNPGEDDLTEHLRRIPDEITMFYRDPHVGHSRQKGGQPGGQPVQYSRPRQSSPAGEYKLSSPLLPHPRSATSNRVIYIKTTAQPKRSKSADRCYTRGFQNASSSSSARGSVRIYRSRGFANPDNLLSDASSQVESPLSTGCMEGHGVTCYASTGLHYRRRRPKPQSQDGEPGTYSLLLKDQNTWTGPDAAVMLRLELERLHWVSSPNTAQSERIEIIKPRVNFGELPLTEKSSDSRDSPETTEEVVASEKTHDPTAELATSSKRRPRRLLDLYISLAGLSLLLSMIVTFYCLGYHSECRTILDFDRFWRWLTQLTNSLASQFSQPEMD